MCSSFLVSKESNGNNRLEANTAAAANNSKTASEQSKALSFQNASSKLQSKCAFNLLAFCFIWVFLSANEHRKRVENKWSKQFIILIKRTLKKEKVHLTRIKFRANNNNNNNLNLISLVSCFFFFYFDWLNTRKLEGGQKQNDK